MNAWQVILAALRTSEFWIALAGIVIEVSSSPVPEEFQVFAWVYVAFRIVSKVAKFIFPNGAAGEWFKNDGGAQ